MLEKFEVGKRYPGHIPASEAPGGMPHEGAHYNFDASGHLLQLFYPGASGDEVRDVRKGDARFAVVYEEPALFLLYKFGSQPWGDAPFTVHLVPEEARRTSVYDADQGGLVNALEVHLVDSRSGVTKALRRFGLPQEFVLAIEAGIREQLSTGWTGKEAYDVALDAVYRRHSSESLLAKAAYATVFRRGGS